MNKESRKPTIVLVHGAVEDSSLWTHGVIQRLQRDGYQVICFSNPLRGVAVDAAYLRSVLDRIEGPVILVSHAYCGAVITQALPPTEPAARMSSSNPTSTATSSPPTCLRACSP